jgi:hypothetical protein
MKKIVKNNTIRKLALEFVAAFLGVLIALLLNGWVESYKESKFIESAFQSVYKTNLENISACEKSIKNLESLIDTVDTYKNNDDYTLIEIIQKNGGIKVESVKMISMHLFRDARFLTKIDYDLISLFGSLEEAHNSLNGHYQQRLTDLINGDLFTKSRNDKNMLILTLQDLKGGFKTVITFSRDVNAELKKEIDIDE